MEARSGTAASRRVNLSQSAMSAVIGRLRTFFDDDLFVMAGRRLVPTPLALSLEASTRDVLFRIRASLIARPEFDPRRSDRRFRMIVSDYASIVLMGEVLKRAHREAPGVGFELIAFDDRVDDPLSRGEVDFLVFPDIYMTDEHPRRHLFSDAFCCVAWAESRAISDRKSTTLN